MIRVRAISPDDWRTWREIRLEALREAPEAFGSTLAEWQGNGDTEERWRRRLTDVPHNVVVELDGRLAGTAGATHPTQGGDVDLISMWVAPFARGRGVGDALVRSVVAWAQDRGARSVSLCVMDGNANAIELYARHGFVDTGIDVVLCRNTGRERRMTLKFRP